MAERVASTDRPVARHVHKAALSLQHSSYTTIHFIAQNSAGKQQNNTYMSKHFLEFGELHFLDDNSLVVKVFDYEVVVLLVDLVDDGFDAGIALD
jgi:hypothetical protein